MPDLRGGEVEVGLHIAMLSERGAGGLCMHQKVYYEKQMLCINPFARAQPYVCLKDTVEIALGLYLVY